MIPYMTVQTLSDGEIDKIHLAMVSILSRTGFSVEHAAIRELYAGYGAHIDHDTGRVRFSESVIDRFLDETDPNSPYNDPVAPDGSCCPTECYRPLCPAGNRPTVTVRSGIDLSPYLEPGTNRAVPFTEGTLVDYIKLARLLDSGIVPRLSQLPLEEMRPTEPLESRLFAWKYGAQESGGFVVTEQCPYLLEMYQIKAAALGRSLAEVFCGSVYIVSPLRFARDICEKLLYFQNHGLRLRIGNYMTTGGTGPITLAGCLALNLAERVAIGILERILYGDKQWVIYGEIVPLDMSNLNIQVNRPELLLANLAVIQLAHHYGVHAHPFGGYTTAKLPSTEAGMQKVMTALPCILAGGCNIDAGKLGDSICSPIQMILDAELIRGLRRALRGFEVDDDTLAVDLIDELGPGGTFTATEHTVRYMRSEFWQPRVWSRETYDAWVASGKKTDVGRALDEWHDLMSRPDPEPGISEETEKQLRAVIDRAAQNLTGI